MKSLVSLSQYRVSLEELRLIHAAHDRDPYHLPCHPMVLGAVSTSRPALTLSDHMSSQAWTSLPPSTAACTVAACLSPCDPRTPRTWPPHFPPSR